MVIQTRPIFQGFGEAKPPCLPVDGSGYAVMQTNPYCKNGWGWLKEGECGCYGGSTLVEPAAPGWQPDKRGCSVKCMGVGPNDCPNCPKPLNWLMVGGIAAGLLGAFYVFQRRK
jgi:hypothetical protein